MSTHSQLHSLPRTPGLPRALGQWQVWVVLGLACVCGYLSLTMHSLQRDQLAHMRLIEAVSNLYDGPPTAADNPQRWLIDAHQRVPSMRRYDEEVSAKVAGLLSYLTERFGAEGRLLPGDQVELSRRLTETLVGLRLGADRLVRTHGRYTQFFYWSLIGFLLSLVMLFTRRDAVADKAAVDALMRDEFLFPHVPVPLMLTGADGSALRVNEAFARLTGYSREETEGRVDPVSRDRTSTEQAYAGVHSSGVWQGEQKLRHRDGSVLSEKLTWVGVGKDPTNPDAYLSIALDSVVSDDEKRLMLWQAHHDNLTKLPNANLLHERLARALAAAQQDNKRGALISIDLNRFQRVNDSFGYENADRVLTDAALRIAMCARETDTVARMGGDLFVIAMHEVESIGDAERVARAALDSVGQPFLVDGEEIFVTASAGLVIFPQDGCEKGEILQKADAARQRAKEDGDGQLMFYEESMNSAAARRMAIETHLRRAVEAGELALHYQPVIDVDTGKVYGAEALLRWNSQQLGFVSPREFIPVAEGSGLIVEIGQWVVQRLCEDLAAWREHADWPELRVSFNVSPAQLSSVADAEALLETLEQHGELALTAELTETALVTGDPGVQVFLEGIKARGVKVALDDFGTGFSSIGYLRDHSFDVLKVDKSFIDGVCDSSRELGLIAAIVAMGRILGMQIVAEGVEEANQVESLKQIGCDFIQGFYYSKPLPVDEFARFVLGDPQQVDSAAG